MKLTLCRQFGATAHAGVVGSSWWSPRGPHWVMPSMGGAPDGAPSEGAPLVGPLVGPLSVAPHLLVGPSRHALWPSW